MEEETVDVASCDCGGCCPNKDVEVVSGVTVVCVNRDSKLVLSGRPTPTAGTVPSSVPFLVGVASGSKLDTVPPNCRALMGRIEGTLLTTYRFGWACGRRTTLSPL